MAVRSETDRLSRKHAWVKNGWRVLLIMTWLFFGLALLACREIGAGGLTMGGDGPSRLPRYALLIMALAWSLLLLYEQFLATNDFNVNTFSFASLLLLGCLAAGYWILGSKAAHVLALLLAAGVFAATFKLHKYYPTVFQPDPEREHPASPLDH
jgi:peptidoglycan/LPS O-acetylase OafA/YrhL